MNLHYSRKFKNIGKRLCIMALAVMMVGTIISAAIPAVNAADYECGLEAHTHTDECYELTCTTPVGEQYGAHAHGEDCFTQVLACECAEGVEHTAECYTSEKVCTLEEGDNVLLSNHTHADACFNTICPKTEHTHTEECEAAVPAPLADDVGTMQITFTTDKPVGSALSGLSVTAGDDIYIDWGDGNIVLFDSTGTTKGSTVKIYSAGDITAFNCTNADITSLDLSGCTGLAELDCSGNKLQFSTLKLPATTPSTMTLSPQAPIEIPAETNYIKGTVDLSSELNIDGSATTYKWYNAANGSQVYPKTSSGGKFGFNYVSAIIDQSIYCEMTNSAFPGMTLTTTETKITENMELLASFNTNLPVGSEMELYTWFESGTYLLIDWGDGTLTPYGSVNSHGNSYKPKGTVKGDTIKIYGPDVVPLKTFWCDNCGVTELDLSGCPELETLDCSDNALTELDLSNNPKLEEAHCENNSLTNLDVSNNPELTVLDCSNNALTQLDLTNSPKLEDLFCGDNNLNVLNVLANPELATLYCDHNALTDLDISSNTKLEDLYCSNNSLNALDVSANPALIVLDCGNNNIPELDVSDCTELTALGCSNNTLTSETLQIPDDLSKMETIVISGNDIASIDLSTATNLMALFVNDTNLSTLDVSNMTDLIMLCCHNTAISSLDLSNIQGSGGIMMLLSFENTNISDLNLPSDFASIVFNGDNAALMFSDLPDPAIMDSMAGMLPDEYLDALINGLPSEFGVSINVDKLFEYAPQAKVEIPEEIDPGEEIDLSSEYEVYGKNTVYKWFDGTTEVTPTTSEGGKFTFGSEFAGKKLRCEMTNENFPDLTLETTEVQVKVPYDKIKITVSGDLEWNNVPSGEDAPEVTVNLMLDGGVVDSVIVPAGTTEYSFADVSKFAADGTELAYTVELDEIPENYEVSYGTPAADADGNITIDITSTYEEPITYGELTISNTVSGEDAPTDAEFTYTVTFDSTDSYSYTGSATGTIKSGDKITLKNGESVKIANIPVGVKFTVTQDEVENFVTSPASGKVEGVIAATPSTAAFSNTYEAPVVTGNLEISNKVTGNNADTTLKFPFKVEFSADGSYEYKITNSNTRAVTTIKSGDTIELAHGETVVIYGLPVGTTYKVTETNTHGYKMTSTGDSGTISAEGSKAAFINEKNKASGGDSNVPDTGDYGTSETVALYVMQIAMMAMLVCIISMKKLKKQNETEQF